MTEADVRGLLNVEPFTISMTGRTSFDIDRPELVSFSPGGGVMNLHNPDGSVRVMLSMDHIVSMTWPAAVPHVRGS